MWERKNNRGLTGKKEKLKNLIKNSLLMWKIVRATKLMCHYTKRSTKSQTSLVLDYL